MKFLLKKNERKKAGASKESKLKVMRWEIDNWRLLFAHVCMGKTQHQHYIRKVGIITISDVKFTEFPSYNSILETNFRILYDLNVTCFSVV